METKRKIIHILTLLWALLLPYLPINWAALLAFFALMFNFFLLSRLIPSVQRTDPKGVDPGIVIYPLSVLLLILFFGERMEVVAGAWALMAVGDGFAGLIGGWIGYPKLPWNSKKSWTGLIAFVVFGIPAVWFMMRWCGSTISTSYLILIVSGATLICALLESLPLPLNDNLTVPLGGGILLYLGVLTADLFPRYLIHQVTGSMILICLLLNLGGAFIAYRFKTLTWGGMIASALVGILVFIFQPWAWGLLLSFFLLGALVTSLRKRYGEKSSSDEEARNGMQVLAKGAVPALFAFLAVGTGYDNFFQFALVASIASALADTVETEIGSLIGRNAFLPTTLEPVPAGTPGAISMQGTLAGVLSSMLMSILAIVFGLIEVEGVPIIMIACFAATFSESFIGADPARRKKLGSLGLNFLVTLVGGFTAIGLFMAM